MPPGMPMKIPIYYVPLWGSPYQILPDGLFINGPAQVGFDTARFVAEQPGWLRNYTEYAYDGKRTGAEIVDSVAQNFSLSPRLLLVLLEYLSAALSQPDQPEHVQQYPLGIKDRSRTGLYLQLIAAADMLNNDYYSWRIGKLTSFEHMDGRLERPDPWQNAATVALQLYFSRLYDYQAYSMAISQDGVAQVYQKLFGDPWVVETSHIPGSLVQPEFALPFEPGLEWALTGGPHTAWGQGEPLAALDFAPGAMKGGCTPTEEWATAVAPGVVTRSELGTVILDLDGIMMSVPVGYLLFSYRHRTARLCGVQLKTGDPVVILLRRWTYDRDPYPYRTEIRRRVDPAAGALAFNRVGLPKRRPTLSRQPGAWRDVIVRAAQTRKASLVCQR
jgi:hypothetical protein